MEDSANRDRSIVVLQQTLVICTLYKDLANFLKMNALGRQNSRSQETFERLTLYEGRIADLRKRLMDAQDTRLESPREVARQSEAKHK